MMNVQSWQKLSQHYCANLIQCTQEIEMNKLFCKKYTQEPSKGMSKLILALAFPNAKFTWGGGISFTLLVLRMSCIESDHGLILSKAHTLAVIRRRNRRQPF